MRSLFMALALALLATPVLALDADEMFADPAMETRARAIGRDLRCLKCNNQSIFDSNAAIAKDLRVAVRDRITAGDSDDEIIAYVRERFGDYVLMRPPVEPYTYLLWLTPVLLLLLGAGGAIAYLRQRPAPQTATLSAEDRAEANRILTRGTD